MMQYSLPPEKKRTPGHVHACDVIIFLDLTTFQALAIKRARWAEPAPSTTPAKFINLAPLTSVVVAFAIASSECAALVASLTRVAKRDVAPPAVITIAAYPAEGAPTARADCILGVPLSMAHAAWFYHHNHPGMFHHPQYLRAVVPEAVRPPQLLQYPL